MEEMVDTTEAIANNSALDQLLPLLQRLDQLLEKALAALIPFRQLIHPTISLSNFPLNAGIKQALPTLSIQNWQPQKPLKLYFEG